MSTRLKEILNRGSLIQVLAITDLKMRYRNSVLGFFWSVLEPLLMLSILYIIFTNIVRIDIPYYPLYLLLGLIMWHMVTRATSMSLNSIVGRSGIIKNIYFPREISPISSCITAFIMMLLEFAVFAAFLVAFQFVPPSTITLIPFLLIIQFVLVLGLSLPLSALNVYFRDMQHIWPIILHVTFFLMPIIYRPTILPEALRASLSAIPMSRIIDMAHDLALYNIIPPATDWAYVTAVSFATLGIGYAIFRRLDARMGEEL